MYKFIINELNQLIDFIKNNKFNKFNKFIIFFKNNKIYKFFFIPQIKSSITYSFIEYSQYKYKHFAFFIPFFISFSYLGSLHIIPFLINLHNYNSHIERLKLYFIYNILFIIHPLFISFPIYLLFGNIIGRLIGRLHKLFFPNNILKKKIYILSSRYSIKQKILLLLILYSIPLFIYKINHSSPF
jgi:hypothetical protein